MGGGGNGHSGEAATVKALATVALVTGGGDNDFAGAAAKVRAGAATVVLNGAGATVDVDGRRRRMCSEVLERRFFLAVWGRRTDAFVSL
jgi:aromatic ring hydroxylase